MNVFLFISVFSKLPTMIIYITSISRKRKVLSGTEKESNDQCEITEKTPIYFGKQETTGDLINSF